MLHSLWELLLVSHRQLSFLNGFEDFFFSLPLPGSLLVVNEAYLELSLVHGEACDGDSKVPSDPYFLILKE